MSFSGEVRKELAEQMSPSRHCQIAELAAMFCYNGKIVREGAENASLLIQTENPQVAKKCFTLLKKTFNIEANVAVKVANSIIVEDTDQAKRLLQAFKLIDGAGAVQQRTDEVHPLLIKNSCCKRAYLRGAYLTAGSMSDPEKSYHLEFVCGTECQAQQLQNVIQDFGMEAHRILRKNHFVVYMKEGSGIVDILNVMEAHKALMNLENLRIVKEMRNSVNRRVNCETANITKTVNASARQVEDIVLIQNTVGLKSLPEGLREMAQVRLEYVDAPLKELGQYMNPPVGKSGVNHRLRKISEIAEGIRDKEGKL